MNRQVDLFIKLIFLLFACSIKNSSHKNSLWSGSCHCFVQNLLYSCMLSKNFGLNYTKLNFCHIYLGVDPRLSRQGNNVG